MLNNPEKNPFESVSNPPINEEEKKLESRRNFLKGAAAFVAVNAAGILGTQAVVRNQENQVALDNIDIEKAKRVMQHPEEYQKELIYACTDAITTLKSIKTEEELAQINDGKVLDILKSDPAVGLSFIVNGMITPILAARAAEPLAKEIDDPSKSYYRVGFVIPGALVASMIIQGSANLHAMEERYAKKPGTRGGVNENIYEAKKIFYEDLKAGKKITRDDIEMKIKSLDEIQKKLLDSVYRVKK